MLFDAKRNYNAISKSQSHYLKNIDRSIYIVMFWLSL
jgi:hypothetical protein